MHHRWGHHVENKYFIWPELKESRKELLSVDQEKGILCELNGVTKKIYDQQFVPQWWVGKEEILTLKLEDFSVNPIRMVQQILTFLELDYDDIEVLVDNDSQASRKRKSSSDWREYFSEPVRDAFKCSYGQLLIDLGYESNLDW